MSSLHVLFEFFMEMIDRSYFVVVTFFDTPREICYVDSFSFEQKQNTRFVLLRSTVLMKQFIY